jgi:hypothetical protein
MPRQIRLNAFDMNCVGHQSPGLWTHPRDRADRYNTLDYWVELARLLERGKFDALFLADVLGVYDVYRGSPDAAIAQAVQVPVNDPLLLIPAMAYVTRNLGFGVTCAVSYEHPYTLARRFSTLDHLTGGRIGWNVVTGYLNSAAKGMGLAQQPEHDTRYEIAEEYMQIVYKRGRVAGKTAQCCATVSKACSRDRKKCIASGTTAPIFGSKPCTSANPHHSARRCSSIRPARRRADANSPRLTPNACSSTGLRSKLSRRSSPTFAGKPRRPDATPPRSTSSR